MFPKFNLLFLLFTTFTTSSFCQNKNVTISGRIKDNTTKAPLPYVNVVLKTQKDSTFVTGTITNEQGLFSITNIKPNNYFFQISYIGYLTNIQPIYVGSLSPFLDVATIELQENINKIKEVSVTAQQDAVSGKMDKKVFIFQDNISQSGGSVLQSMLSLPGITVQDGKVQLRGNDKITVLIDGKQTALTGFGNQSGLDNIPSSAIEKIEIINNPSSKYDANGNAGIINIVTKKTKQDGFTGKIGFTSGIGSLWIRQENLPGMRPQYTLTPKINPSLTLTYRKNKINLFFQADNLYTQTLNKNEFVTRTYTDGTIINQQLKRNRNTNFLNSKAGFDWSINNNNTLTISALFGSEKIIDRGDQPFFNGNNYERLRLWQFLEDELKTTAMATTAYQHKFKQAGNLFNFGFNYTFHREDEKYFYNNFLPSTNGTDAFKLISDEQVYDFNLDYLKPFKYGRLETGLKLRNRIIPTNMQFIPGENSVLDNTAGGWATYKEIIPAFYGNYVLENKTWEAEIGIRVEYVKIQYDVNPNHPTYKSDGYKYTQPFPTASIAYKINDNNRISLFFNRRVDRPNEVDIRIFPKYDDAEIIKVGNPALRPQFTNSLELAYKTSYAKGYFYSAAYHRFSEGTITRISTIAPSSNRIYAIFQNAGTSYNTGVEFIVVQEINRWYSFNLNLNGYHNQINAFSVISLYPVTTTFSASKQEIISGNIKLNNTIHLPHNINAQFIVIYLAPDIIPQGIIAQRFSADLGIKKSVQAGKGELFLNATDIFNTMIIKKEIHGQGFNYISTDYYETQVVRIGYTYKF